MNDFDWAQISHSDLYKIMLEISPKVQNKPLSPQQFHRIAAANLRKHLPIIVVLKYNKIVRPRLIYMGGAYHPSLDQAGKKCIEINFNYDPLKTELKLTPIRMHKISVLFADTMLHEIIHMRQYRSRDYEANSSYPSKVLNQKKRDEQSYLGNPDEIEAYSFNIACELIRKYNSDQQKASDHLDLEYRLSKDNFSKYLRMFDKDHTHPVIIKLKKMVRHFIPRAISIGKPYIRSKWLKN